MRPLSSLLKTPLVVAAVTGSLLLFHVGLQEYQYSHGQLRRHESVPILVGGTLAGGTIGGVLAIWLLVNFDEFKDTIEGIDKNIKGIDREIDSVNKEIKGVDKKINELQNNIKSVDGKIENIDKKVKDLQDKHDHNILVLNDKFDTGIAKTNEL